MPLFASGLALMLPNGTNRWVGLLLAEPDEVAGTYDEVVDEEYARVAHSAWTNVDNGDGRLARRNNGAVVFGAIKAATIVTHWAIFDAAVAGGLIAAGPVLNGDGVEQPTTIPVNDNPRFNDGDIMLLSSEAVV